METNHKRQIFITVCWLIKEENSIYMA